MQHDLPDGFYRWPGNREPRGNGPWHIMLRNGFVDTRIGYTTDQLVWHHKGHCGDVVAVRRA